MPIFLGVGNAIKFSCVYQSILRCHNFFDNRFEVTVPKEEKFRGKEKLCKFKKNRCYPHTFCLPFCNLKENNRLWVSSKKILLLIRAFGHGSVLNILKFTTTKHSKKGKQVVQYFAKLLIFPEFVFLNPVRVFYISFQIFFLHRIPRLLPIVNLRAFNWTRFVKSLMAISMPARSDLNIETVEFNWKHLKLPFELQCKSQTLLAEFQTNLR